MIDHDSDYRTATLFGAGPRHWTWERGRGKRGVGKVVYTVTHNPDGFPLPPHRARPSDGGLNVEICGEVQRPGRAPHQPQPERGEPMRILNDDIAPAAAEQALLQLGQHLPPGVAFGRPMFAARGDDGDIVIFCAEPDGDSGVPFFVTTHSVTRLVGLDGGAVERVEFRNGREVSRFVGTPE